MFAIKRETPDKLTQILQVSFFSVTLSILLQNKQLGTDCPLVLYYSNLNGLTLKHLKYYVLFILAQIHIDIFLPKYNIIATDVMPETIQKSLFRGITLTPYFTASKTINTIKNNAATPKEAYRLLRSCGGKTCLFIVTLNWLPVSSSIDAWRNIMCNLIAVSHQTKAQATNPIIKPPAMWDNEPVPL